MDQTPLKSLEDKLEQLLNKFQLLQKENKKLKEGLHETETLLAKCRKSNEELRLQNDAFQLGSAKYMDENQQKLLQNRIDRYLKEINKCLSLLDA